MVLARDPLTLVHPERAPCRRRRPTNAASIFNYRRLGFAHVGTEHRVRRDPVDGKVFDLLAFEIFREHWQQGPFAEKLDEHA